MNTFSYIASYALFRFTDIFHPYKERSIISLFVLSYLALTIILLHNYFIIDFTVLSALVLSPYIIKPATTKKGKTKYLWWSLTFLLLACLSGVKTFYFLAIGTAILFSIESFAGPIGHLPFFLLGLLSPTFKYFNNMLGFPARLQLSEWAGKIIQLLGYKIEVAGNVLVLNGTEFSIDPACVGLKMMAFSLLAGLVIMAFFQQHRGKPFSFLLISFLLLIIVGLNIFSNLIRILMLTLFKIMPNNPCHDVVGIICFLLYIILPSWFLIKWLAKKSSKDNQEAEPKPKKPGKTVLINCLLLVIIITTGFTIFNRKKTPAGSIPHITLSGYSQKIVDNDILKLEKPGTLIYIKPMQRFYGAEHNPMICWVGSGYEFKKINKQFYYGKEVFTGILKKGTDTIYSAWWFDNGSYPTIHQLDWRWRALKGEKFYLVNVNSTSPANLLADMKDLLRNRTKYQDPRTKTGFVHL